MGDLFLRLLKMVIIPLIFTSLVSGVASLGDARSVGRIGIRTLVYYTATTALAVSVGLTLVNLIRPGRGLQLHYFVVIGMKKKKDRITDTGCKLTGNNLGSGSQEERENNGERIL